jgi:hypothetical protein
VRRWIPPVRPAPAAGTAPAETAAPAVKPQVRIRSALELAANVEFAPEPFLGQNLPIYEFLHSGTPQFSAYEVTRPEAVYVIDNAFRDGYVKELKEKLSGRLGRRADQLEADIRHHERRLGEYLQEGWPFTIRRGDIDLRKHEHMFDSPKAHLSAARGNISLGAFRHAWDSVQRGEADVVQNFKLLYHYAEGKPYEGPE